MIPLSLTLKGIYSYQKEQTIDFRTLADAHLFGIFGPVGSGKSTILEAMTFALYDRTERLHRKRDNLAHNMKNLRSDELLIRFHFLAGENQEEEFCFEVSYDGRKKSSGFKRTQKVRQKGRWVIKEINAEEVLGLSYENFRRTVIIPQGKFQEFLQLGPADRTRMLQELFDLERFDLAEPVKVLRVRNDNALSNLEGQLQTLGEVDTDTLADLEKRLAEARTVREKLQKELGGLLKKEEEFRQLQELFEKICGQKEKLAEMTAQEAEVKKREEELQVYHYCVQHFQTPLEQRAELAEEVRKGELALAEKKNAAADKKEQLATLEQRFGTVREQYLQREALLRTAEELEKLVEIRRLKGDCQQAEALREKWQKEISGCESEMAALEEKRQAVLRKCKEKKAAAQRWESVPQVAAWFSTAEQLKGQIARCEAEIADLDETLAQIRAEVALPSFWRTSQRAGMTLPALLEALEKSRRELAQTVQQHEEALKHLRVQTRLAEFADALRPGEPCPLCGATEHPAPMDGRGLSERLAELEAKMNTATKQLQELQTARQKLERLAGQQEAQLARREGTVKKQAELCRELAAHREKFCWADFDPDDPDAVEKAQQQARQEREEISRLEELAENTEEKLLALREKNQELQKKLQEKSQELAVISGQHHTLQRQIRHIDPAAYADRDIAHLQEEAQQLRQRHRQIEEEYRQLEQKKGAVEKDFARLDGEIAAVESRLGELQERRKALERDLQQRLAGAPLDDLAAVEQLLARPLDIAAEQQAIEQFYREKHAAALQLEALHKEAAGRTYDEATHAQLQEKNARLREEIETQDRSIGGMVQELTTARRNLEMRRKLEKKRAELQNRAANLETLAGLFRGRGFVNFVSRIHLEQLCRAANERFRQLTRQQLALELTDNNDFQVRDYLHGGETRSIKTLSGGQTFQASLSLALALADSVRQLARTPHNFFFLDEGFGTLDRESLRLVFDTLKSLRREQRIVGLISHVEELQEEIEVHLRVENDEQTGSRITYSWA